MNRSSTNQLAMNQKTMINNLRIFSSGIKHINEKKYLSIINELDRLEVINFILENKTRAIHFNINKLSQYLNDNLKLVSKQIQIANPSIKFNI